MSKIFIFLILPFFIFVSCNKFPSKIKETDTRFENNKDNEDYHKGIKLFNDKNYKSAFEIFAKLQKKYPDNSEINYYLGAIYAKSFNLKGAEIYLNKSLKLNKKEWRAHRDLAVLYKAFYKYEDALKEVKEVFKYEKNDPISNFIMAYLSNKLEHNDKAYVYYERAVKSSKTYMLAYIHYGEFYYSRKQYEKAEKVWLEGLKKRYSTTIALRLGALYEKLKKYDKALKIYHELIKKYPQGSAEIEYHIANIYQKRGNIVKAIELYKAIIKKKKDYDAPKIALAEIYVKLKKYNEALNIYKDLNYKYIDKTTLYLYKQAVLLKKMKKFKRYNEVLNQLKKSDLKESKDYLDMLSR